MGMKASAAAATPGTARAARGVDTSAPHREPPAAGASVPADSGRQQDRSRAEMRLYRTPWKGEALFACAKCQRKIGRRGGPKALGKIRKWFRRHSRSGSPVSVLNIPCVGLCPKGGVTIFSARDLRQSPAGVHIAWSEEDLERIASDMSEG
jgi:hypothetical protein